jgi:hypothetical protein
MWLKGILFMATLRRTAIMTLILVASICTLPAATWPAGDPGRPMAQPQSAPGNDDINNAVSISSLPYTSPSLDISTASEAGSDPQYSPACYDSPETNYKPYRTVWYTYTASQTAVMRVETTASDYDTVLAVWHGSPGSLTLAACNDDTDGGQQSSLDVWVTQSTDYYIEVAAFSAVETGNLVLRVEFVPNLIFLPLVTGE